MPRCVCECVRVCVCLWHAILLVLPTAQLSPWQSWKSSSDSIKAEKLLWRLRIKLSHCIDAGIIIPSPQLKQAERGVFSWRLNSLIHHLGLFAVNKPHSQVFKMYAGYWLAHCSFVYVDFVLKLFQETNLSVNPPTHTHTPAVHSCSDVLGRLKLELYARLMEKSLGHKIN